MICLGFTRPPEYLEGSIRLAESMGFSVRAAPSLIRIPAPENEFIEIFKGWTAGISMQLYSIRAPL